MVYKMSFEIVIQSLLNQTKKTKDLTNSYRFLLLSNPDRLFSSARRIRGNLPNQSLDQRVLVHVFGAEHHVLLGLPVLAGHRIKDLLLI